MTLPALNQPTTIHAYANTHTQRRLFAFTDENGKTKPGMIRPLITDNCAAVHLELWDVPTENFGKFISQVRFFRHPQQPTTHQPLTNRHRRCSFLHTY